MNLEQKIDDLQKLVSEYDTEQFAGFFAYFIKHRPDVNAEIAINNFESKLKDFLYLISLNVFAENTGTKEIGLTNDLDVFAQKLNQIKGKDVKIPYKDYSLEKTIHDLALSNHFDNGVLSYNEQDLERLRRIFAPYNDLINQDFGLDIECFIDICKEIELIALIRRKQSVEFMCTKEFIQHRYRLENDNMDFVKSFELLPQKIQDDYLQFHEQPYRELIFSANDLCYRFEKEKVNKFLKLLSCDQDHNSRIRYYTAESPFELKPLLKLKNGSYLSLYSKQLPISIHKILYTHLLMKFELKDKLRKHREDCLEIKVSEIFKKLFPKKDTEYFENYYIEKNVEQDLLLIYRGNVIIVETKASKLREPFRIMEKAIVRLKDDFKDSIQYGFEQCKRVEDYFFGDNSFAIKDEKGKTLKTIEPQKLKSVLSIVVTLERFGGLQTDLGLMLKKDEDIDFPWSVYIDDLETFAMALRQNTKNYSTKFIDFLFNRRELHGRVHSIDELDICASFIRKPFEFKNCAKSTDAFVLFSPHEQEYFDQLYFEGKLRFDEKPLPEEFYKYGI